MFGQKPKAKKRSFFEKLTGGIRLSDENGDAEKALKLPVHEEQETNAPDEDVEGELALDVYQTASDIIVQTFVAGVRPEDLEINIGRDMLTIRGRREETKSIHEEDFFSRELYWGAFSRTISLPQEVEPEDAEAIERHGLLTIRLPKIDKNKKSSIKVKSI